jgi:hypothetical protein
MTTPTIAELSREFARIQASGEISTLVHVATEYAFPASLWIAINSRETNCVNELGDFRQGVYNGVGMCQVDIQHDIARNARNDGSWKTPEGFAALQSFGAALLAANIAKVRADFDDLTDYDVWRIAADGYNENILNAEHDAEDGGDEDRRTTGHDYGVDVMARKAVFDRLLEGSTT